MHASSANCFSALFRFCWIIAHHFIEHTLHLSCQLSQKAEKDHVSHTGSLAARRKLAGNAIVNYLNLY